MGMRVVRWLGLWAGTGLWVAVLAPALALLPASVLDRGPGGAVRATFFPLALAALDPFLWDCAWNSVVVALVVASGSLVLGTRLARVAVGRRFWGRPALVALTIGPVAVPTLFVAIGLRQLAAPALVGPGIGGWVGWAWVALASGVPLVALATASALARVDPAWTDAARLSGASPRQIWRTLVWPVVRPVSARAAGMVFALTLIEPGAPLVLGLRRTLAFQLVEAALGPDPAPRASVLALAAVAIAAVGRLLAGWWGGGLSTWPVEPPDTPGRAEPVRWPRAVGYVATLGTGAVLAWLPILALLATALAGPGPSSGVGRLGDDVSRRLMFNSVALGLAVVAIDLALVWTLGAWAGRRRGWVLALAAWPELLPPMALGVGALTLPGVLALAADGLKDTGTRAALARGFRMLADGLDLDRSPGVLLALAVAATRLPYLSRVVEHGWSRNRLARIDAALTLGATPHQARRAATGLGPGVPTAALVLTFALAATNLAPALLLAPTIEARPLSPGVLILADAPGDGLTRASALACVAVAVNLAALALSARRRGWGMGVGG